VRSAIAKFRNAFLEELLERIDEAVLCKTRQLSVKKLTLAAWLGFAGSCATQPAAAEGILARTNGNPRLSFPATDHHPKGSSLAGSIVLPFPASGAESLVTPNSHEHESHEPAAFHP